MAMSHHKKAAHHMKKAAEHHAMAKEHMSMAVAPDVKMGKVEKKSVNNKAGMPKMKKGEKY